MIADLEELKTWTHQTFTLEETTHKKYSYHKKEMNSFSRNQMVQQNSQEETTNSENPLLGGNNPLGAKISVENLKVNGGESQPTAPTDDAEARADFWSIQGDFIYRHHNEPRVQLRVPTEETFPIPLKYSDVARTADNWNVDGDRELSDAWTGFTKFILLNEKPP